MTKGRNKVNKIESLLRDGRELYHTQDLRVLWNMSNSNTLYTTIRRYVERGLLYRIYKGFYSTKPVNKIDPVELGLVALHSYGHLSTESVLAKEGIIFQEVKYITLVSDASKRIDIAGCKFLVRKMKNDYLYNDAGIVFNGRIRKASPERAVADMLYFNPDYYFDAHNSINWGKVESIKKEVGY